MSETPAPYRTASPETFTPSRIRYRVWDGKRMHYPSPASYSATSMLVASNGRGVVASGHEWHVDGALVPLLSTGLRDADGREVFEGDLLADGLNGGMAAPVVYAHGEWGTDYIGSLADLEHPTNGGRYRVVGNVYEGLAEPSGEAPA